jgi:hypothetical protein
MGWNGWYMILCIVVVRIGEEEVVWPVANGRHLERSRNIEVSTPFCSLEEDYDCEIALALIPPSANQHSQHVVDDVTSRLGRQCSFPGGNAAMLAAILFKGVVSLRQSEMLTAHCTGQLSWGKHTTGWSFDRTQTSLSVAVLLHGVDGHSWWRRCIQD